VRGTVRTKREGIPPSSWVFSAKWGSSQGQEKWEQFVDGHRRRCSKIGTVSGDGLQQGKSNFARYHLPERRSRQADRHRLTGVSIPRHPAAYPTKTKCMEIKKRETKTNRMTGGHHGRKRRDMKAEETEMSLGPSGCLRQAVSEDNQDRRSLGTRWFNSHMAEWLEVNVELIRHFPYERQDQERSSPLRSPACAQPTWIC